MAIADSARVNDPASSRLWWWVGAAFAVQIAVWAAWLVFASHHRVEEVPVATAPARPPAP